MSRTGSALTLTPAARQFLADELRAVANASARRGDPGRIALTFRPSRRGRDGLAGGPVPLDSFRLLVLTHRDHVDALGHRRHGAVLEVLRPVLRPAWPLALGYRRERIHDLAAPRPFLTPGFNATAARAAVLLHRAIDDSGPGPGPASPPAWPRLYVGFGDRDRPVFGPATTRADRDAAEAEAGGLRAWPAGMLSGSSDPVPPHRVFASLAHLKGRRVRNPAFAVLRRRGLIGRGLGYRAWLGTVGAMTERGHVPQDARDEATAAGRLRLAIGAYLAADPRRERALLDEMRAGCDAFGIRVAEGDDALAELLDNPWSRPEVHYAGGIQLAGRGALDDLDGPGVAGGGDAARDESMAGPDHAKAQEAGRPA